jgi:hypothetical protein
MAEQTPTEGSRAVSRPTADGRERNGRTLIDAVRTGLPRAKSVRVPA